MTNAIIESANPRRLRARTRIDFESFVLSRLEQAPITSGALTAPQSSLALERWPLGCLSFWLRLIGIGQLAVMNAQLRPKGLSRQASSTSTRMRAPCNACSMRSALIAS
jgi:hypothetical protein